MYLFLLIPLLIFLVAPTYSMQQENSSTWHNFSGKVFEKIKSCSSVLSNKRYIPERVKEIRKKRDKLESQLKTDLVIGFVKRALPQAFYYSTYESCICFLRYIYFEKYRESENLMSPFANLENDPALIAKCQDFKLDGYSALGVAVICLTGAVPPLGIGHFSGSPNLSTSPILAPVSFFPTLPPGSFHDSLEKKRRQIEMLLRLGFKPTNEDMDLSYLELYERTLEDSHRKIMLLFLTEKYKVRREVGLPSLHLHIIQKIAKYITSEQPLLPPLPLEN